MLKSNILILNILFLGNCNLLITGSCHYFEVVYEIKKTVIRRKINVPCRVF
jgi:hypothetical protein